jgi:hypothetical protein
LSDKREEATEGAELTESTKAVAAQKALMLMTEALDLVDAFGMSAIAGNHIELARREIAQLFADQLGGEDTLMNIRLALLLGDQAKN